MTYPINAILLFLALASVNAWPQGGQSQFSSQMGLGRADLPTGTYIPFTHSGKWKLEKYELNESLDINNFLQRRGIHPDENSARMFEDLNPGFSKILKGTPVYIVVPDGTGEIIVQWPPGQSDNQFNWSHYTWEEWDSQKKRLRLPRATTSPTNDLLLKYSAVTNATTLPFAAHHAQAIRIQEDAYRLDRSAYSVEPDQIIHRASVETISKFAQTLEQTSDKLSAQDTALASIYLDMAKRDAKVVNGQAASSVKIQSNSVKQLDTTTKPLKEIQDNVEKNRPLFPKRQIKVEVHRSPNAPEPTPLRVYMLPSMFTRSDLTFSVDEIAWLLTRFTFPSLTTPSLNDAVPDAEWLVWLGKDHQYTEMAKLVASRKLMNVKYTPISRGLDSLTLPFWAPHDVVVP